MIRQKVVHPVEAAPVRAGPEGIPVGDERQAGGESFHHPVAQADQVDDIQASDSAHHELVRCETGTEAGGGLHGILMIGEMAQVVVVQPVVRRDPDKVVDGVVDHAEDDVDALGRFRLVAVRDEKHIGGVRVDEIQPPGHRTRPDPSLTVLAEGCDGAFRAIVPELQVPDLPADTVLRGREPEDVVAVDEHRPDRGGRDRGGRRLDAGEVDDLERFLLDDGQAFRFEADPDLAAPRDEAAHHLAREEPVPILVEAGAVDVE